MKMTSSLLKRGFLSKKQIFFLIFSLVLSISLAIKSAQAANLLNAKDTLSTSLPNTPATHTIQFQPTTEIPQNGKIIITFQDDFDFNGLTTSSIVSNNANCTFSVSAPVGGEPNISCTLSNSISSNTTVTIIAGCTSQTNGVCTNESPTILNPSKILSEENADIWKVNIATQNSSGGELDFIIAKMAAIEGTLLTANVASTFTFTIGGVNNNQPINTGNNVGCTNSETTNSGFNATNTSINLGKLGNTPSSIDAKLSNITAQLMTVTTNVSQGYTITATSSSSLKNLASNYEISSSATPSAFITSEQMFGLHACGLDVNATYWTEIDSQSCSTVVSGSAANECKYAWPNPQSNIILSSDSTGPIGNSASPGNGMVSVEYAAGIDSSVPAGDYQTTITYTATPIF